MCKRSRVRLFIIAALLVTAACGGDDDDATTDVTDPGPNPTTEDPGPNDTSTGPQTVQGVTHLDPAAGCITLSTNDGVLVLTFQDYELGDDGAPAIISTSDDRTLAHDGDEMVVSGRLGTEDPACGGMEFAVESLNSVTPAT